jgi:hypothetical protein
LTFLAIGAKTVAPAEMSHPFCAKEVVANTTAKNNKKRFLIVCFFS